MRSKKDCPYQWKMEDQASPTKTVDMVRPPGGSAAETVLQHSLQAANTSMGAASGSAVEALQARALRAHLALTSAPRMPYANPKPKQTQPAVSSLQTDKQIQWTQCLRLTSRAKTSEPTSTSSIAVPHDSPPLHPASCNTRGTTVYGDATILDVAPQAG